MHERTCLWQQRQLQEKEGRDGSIGAKSSKTIFLSENVLMKLITMYNEYIP